MTKLFSTTCALWVLGMSSLFAAAEDAPLSDELVTAGAARQVAPHEDAGHEHQPIVQTAPILNLPDEMLLKVFGYLKDDLRSLLRISGTCQLFRGLSATLFSSKWQIGCDSSFTMTFLNKQGQSFLNDKGESYEPKTTKQFPWETHVPSLPPYVMSLQIDCYSHLTVTFLNKQGQSFLNDKGESYVPKTTKQFPWETHVTSLPPYVRSLCIHNVNLSPEQLSIVLSSISTHPNLRELNLWNTTIDDDGATAIATTLKTNRTLTSLYLTWNDIGAAGATALAKALQTNTFLRKLNLFNNNIGAAGANAIAMALQTNTTLRELNLEWNDIGAETKAQLRDLAAARPGLKIVL